jgi:aspartyl aminopeptidase
VCLFKKEKKKKEKKKEKGVVIILLTCSQNKEGFAIIKAHCDSSVTEAMN